KSWKETPRSRVLWQRSKCSRATCPWREARWNRTSRKRSPFRLIRRRSCLAARSRSDERRRQDEAREKVRRLPERPRPAVRRERRNLRRQKRLTAAIGRETEKVTPGA